MNTPTMEGSGTFLLTTADLAKSSPRDDTTMSLVSLTNAVRTGSVISTESRKQTTKVEEPKVSDLCHMAPLQGLAKHVGVKEDDERSKKKMTKSKSSGELSPRRVSNVSPRRATHCDVSPRRATHCARERIQKSKSRHERSPAGRSRKERSSGKEKETFDISKAASMLATPAAKEDKASEAAAFLLACSAATKSERRSLSPDMEEDSETRRRRPTVKDGSRRRSSSQRLRRPTTTRAKDSLDSKSSHVPRRPTAKDSLDSRSQHKRSPRRGSEDKRERRRPHGRRTQSQPEGGMVKPTSVKPRRVQSQPEGGALEEAACEIRTKAGPPRHPRSGRTRQQRGPRSGAQAMGSVQLQQVLQQEIKGALEVADDDQNEFEVKESKNYQNIFHAFKADEAPSSPKIKEGMDLNTVDLTALDSAAVQQLLAQSMHNKNHLVVEGQSTKNSIVVLPIVHDADAKQQAKQQRGRRKTASSRRNVPKRSGSWGLADLSSDDDSDDEFA